MSPCTHTSNPHVAAIHRDYHSDNILKFNNKRTVKRIQRSMPAGERRRVCETWVRVALEDASGVDTPLATLYNAYIKAHPEAYLDIAQVGKVLKAKYPNRKHRRGKQGSQLYVYRDVAIKKNNTNETKVPVSKQISENAIPLKQSRNRNNLISGSSLSTIKVNFPGGDNLEVQNLTWAAECKLKSKSVMNDVSIAEEENTPKDMPIIEIEPKSKINEKRKRDVSTDNKSSKRLKRRRSSYYYDETYRIQKICHTKNDENIHAKNTRSRDVETKSIINPEQVAFLKVLGMQHISTANAPHKRTSHRIRNSPKRSYKSQPSIEDNVSENVINNKTTKVKTDYPDDPDEQVTSTTDIKKEESKELGTSSTDDDFDSNVGSSRNSSPLFLPLKEECDLPLPESKISTDLTQLKLPTEVKLYETPTVINDLCKQEQDICSNSDQICLEYDVKSRQNRSDIEAFRKSVGRQWIDDHIRQKNGVVTTTAEVCAAYNKDHPEAQLTQTNLSMIIRSKFPQRYKLHGTEYVYQDLEFVKDGIPDEDKRNVNTIPEFTAPPRHRKPKESLLPQESNIDTKQLTFNNIPSPVKHHSFAKKTVSPLHMNMHLANSQNAKPQIVKAEYIVPQDQFKSTYTSSVINYKGVPYIAVLGTPNVSPANNLPDTSKNVIYSSNIEECALDLSLDKSVQQSSIMYEKTSESKKLQEQQYSHHTEHINTSLFQNVSNNTKNNFKNLNCSDINYRSYVEKDEDMSISKQEILIDDEEPELVIDEDYESKNENSDDYNREEISSKTISKVDSSTSADMGVDDYIKGEIIQNRKITVNNQPRVYMKKSYNFNEHILPEKDISYLCTIDKSKRIFKHEDHKHNKDNVKLGLSIEVDKTGALNLIKDDIRNCHYDTKSIKNNSAINKFEASMTQYKVIDSFDNRATKHFGNFDSFTETSQKTVEQVNAIKITSHKLAESDGLKNPKTCMENYGENMNISLLRRVLVRALSMTSAINLELRNEERAKEMEQSIYPNNSAVSYSIPCVWPSINTRDPKDFPCKPAAGIQAILLRTTDDQLAQLLLHHQQCPGLGCRICHPLRAALVHLIIHRHRCQIWLTLMMLIARHSRECKLAKCSYEFCLFVKHHIHLSGEPILAKHSLEEQQQLEAEFRKCRKAGVHGPHMNCNHRSQWKIPKFSESTPVPRSLQLLADILSTDGECESKTDPVISSLQIASILPIYPR